MKNKIMDGPMVRKGIKERLVSRVMALVGLAVLYGVLGCFISLGLDDRPAVCWSLMGVLGISFVSALVVFLFEGRMSAPTAFRAKKAVVGLSCSFCMWLRWGWFRGMPSVIIFLKR